MFEKIKESFGKKISNIFNSKKELNDIVDEIEETLILSDVGALVAMKICEELKKKAKCLKEYTENNIKELLRNELINIIEKSNDSDIKEIFLNKKVVLVVGVNGVGKTTSIAKLANLYKKEGKKILLCAADTFRAGAVEQLKIWADRVGVECVCGIEKTDPSAIVFDATKKFNNSNYDILICDTAGRLQNKKTLMEELEKVKRTIEKNIDSKYLEVLMVLDASTGQNAVNQVKTFYETTSIDGIILTKMDGTSKGGVVFSIIDELKLPIKYIGTGEKLEDIEVFNSRKFVEQII